MIKNLMDKVGKDKPKEKKQDDPEILELRKKFEEVKKTPVAMDPQTRKPVEESKEKTFPNRPPQTTAPPPSKKPRMDDVKVKLIDAEQAEKDERMTNMIMEQIKELIEIDNNLNNKIKDMDAKVEATNNEIAKTQEKNEEMTKKMGTIEKSMEKFMGLYEVVTNQYNPFVSGSKEAPPDQKKEPQQAEPPAPDKAQAQEVKVEAEPAAPPSPRPSQPPDTSKIEPGETQDQAPAMVKESFDLSKVDDRISHALESFRADYDQRIMQIIDSKITTTLKRIESTINDQLQGSIQKIIDNSISSRMRREEEVKETGQEEKDDTSDQGEPDEAFEDKMTEPGTEDAKEDQMSVQEPAEPQPKANEEDEPEKPTETEASDEKREDDNRYYAEKDEEDKALHHETEVHHDDYFYLPNGKPVKSLRELVEEINIMSDEDFTSHVSDEKNDFSEWIEHVINDKALSDKIRPLRTKHDMLSVLMERIGS